MIFMPTTYDLRSYRAMVADAMQQAETSKSPVVFENTGSAHAAIVLDVMIGKAALSLDVVSGFLDKTVWNVDVLRAFLARSPNAQVRILLDELDEDVIPSGSALSEIDDEGRIKVKRLPVVLGTHFCIADKKHVRLEAVLKTHQAS